MAGIRVVATGDLPRDIGRLQRLGMRLTGEGRNEWSAATEALFETSQELVHVDTGELKASGRVEMSSAGATVTGKVIYEAPQGYFEEQRGGDHAFLTRAAQLTDRVFDEAALAMVRYAVEGQ